MLLVIRSYAIRGQAAAPRFARNDNRFYYQYATDSRRWGRTDSA